ncbi:MAG: ABC transporter permease [Oscillospiraceae bacterium]|jgi:spermidine/putrescine transport system permease protein|nr:ABC transporter permease [Oscillospiraceae bacterium]
MNQPKKRERINDATPALNAPYLLWSLLFIVAPLAMVAVYAFLGQNNTFSLDVFRSLFATADGRRMWGKVFGDSLLYALAATVICLGLAFPLAHFMAAGRARAQRTMMMLIMVPMWMNFLICTYSWRTILETHGVINSFLSWLRLPGLKLLNTPGAVVLGMVYNYLPFMILPVYSVMSKLNPSLVEAAQDLGANRRAVLFRVTVPLSLPGVVSGIIMVFVPSVSTFYISQKLGGKGSLIGDAIEAQFMVPDYGKGAALSLILMAIILVCMMAMRRFSDGEEGSFIA